MRTGVEWKRGLLLWLNLELDGRLESVIFAPRGSAVYSPATESRFWLTCSALPWLRALVPKLKMPALGLCVSCCVPNDPCSATCAGPPL